MRFVEREKKEDKKIKKYLFILYFYYLKKLRLKSTFGPLT